MKLKQIFWGLFFVAAGFAVIAGQMGYLGEVNLFTLVLTLLLLPIIFKSIVRLHFFGILVPLSIIAILYAKELNIAALTPWPLLLTALFVSTGLTIIFYSSKRNHRHYHLHHENFDTIIDEKDESYVHTEVSMGSSVKYVNANEFKKGVFKCTCGALKIYFDGSTVSSEGAEIILDISLSGVELYIPKSWNIQNQLHTSLGGVEEKNKSDKVGPTVVLKGNVSLSGVEIIYI
ncbi:MAG: hypothetical protein PHN72_03425 [Bacilli bacterium]|nr:hypothetical protein [Bacilli bacterium]